MKKIIYSLFLIIGLLTIPTAQATSASIVKETNKYRLEANLNPLTINNQLNIAAQKKADDMAKRSYFAHVTPEGDHSWGLISGQGYSYLSAGENISQGYSARSVTKAWYLSPSHRNNLLKPQFKDIGIGIAKGKLNGHNTVFIVQIFAQPK